MFFKSAVQKFLTHLHETHWAGCKHHISNSSQTSLTWNRKISPLWLECVLFFKYKGGIWDWGNTQGTLRTDLHGFMQESFIQPGPAQVSFRPHRPSNQLLAQRQTHCGPKACVWIALKKLQFWLPELQAMSLFQDPQGKQTLRLQVGTKPGTTQWECSGVREEGEETKTETPRPRAEEPLLCQFYPYLEKQKRGNRTNFIFFRYFRNSFSFQL